MLIVVVASIALLITDNRSTRLDGIRSFLSLIVYPVQFIVSLPATVTNQAMTAVYSYSNLLKEHNKLKKNHLITKAKLLKFKALEKENIRLRALLANSFKLGEQVLVAELLSVNLVPYEHTVLINKGSRFGVHAHQPVMNADGIVGQVIRSTPLTSEIILITDPNHAIPVQVNRNGLRTIAVGSGHLNRLNLPFLPNNADIVPGDLLITSGLGGRFPHGYPVAIIDNFNVQSGKPFAEVHASPKAQLDKTRELLIVWSNSKPVPLIKPIQSENQNSNVTE